MMMEFLYYIEGWGKCVLQLTITFRIQLQKAFPVN